MHCNVYHTIIIYVLNIAINKSIIFNMFKDIFNLIFM